MAFLVFGAFHSHVGPCRNAVSPPPFVVDCDVRVTQRLASCPCVTPCSRCAGSVVPVDATSKISGLSFVGYGTHCDAYPTAYFTAAAAIGLEKPVCCESATSWVFFWGGC